MSFKVSLKPMDILAEFIYFHRDYTINENPHAVRNIRHKVITAFESQQSSVLLCLITCYIHLQSGDVNLAQPLLDKLFHYRNFYKQYNPEFFIAINYNMAILEIKQENFSKAVKYIKNIEENKDVNIGFSHMLLGDLMLQSNNLEQAFNHFENSISFDFNSPFLYAGLFEIFNNKYELDFQSVNVLLSFLNWASSHLREDDERVINILSHYEEFLSILPLNNFTIRAILNVYNKYKASWALTKICEYLILRKNTTVRAFEYYSDAIKKQLEISKLYNFYLNTAIENKIEGISRYAITNYLKEQGDELDVDNLCYLYHIMLCDEKYFDMAQKYQQKIVYFLYYCFENNIQNRYVLTISRYVLSLSSEIKIPESYLGKIEAVLKNNMFLYDVFVADKNVSYIWYIEDEKRNAAKYELGRQMVTVTACSEAPEVVCVCGTKNSIVESKVIIEKRIKNAGMDMFLHFYKKGLKTEDIKIQLSKYILELKDYESDDTGLVEVYIDILTETLNLSEISKTFKMRISAALGNILYIQNRYDKALLYYEGVDENCLNDMVIEQMLKVFVNTGEFEKATRLIMKKSHCISDRTLFGALKRIGIEKKYDKLIADAAYELILKSWYDKTLLNITLKHYKGSQQDWQELSKTLALISASDENLDEIIIKNSIWMHKFDSGTQKVYCRMFEQSPDNEYVGLFTYYCVFEVLINNTKPEYSTIDVMEKLFLEYLDSILGYALCTVYIEHNVKTLHSDEIIAKVLEILENKGEMLPIFKKIKDKRFQTPYIIKNLPFIYRCLPNKNVFVHVRFDDNEEFMPIKMGYLRFGLYIANVSHFYNEKITYYFSEEMPTGSIVTKEYTAFNNTVYVDEASNDPFFVINNAICFEQMFKYDKVEKIINEFLKENQPIRGTIL